MSNTSTSLKDLKKNPFFVVKNSTKEQIENVIFPNGLTVGVKEYTDLQRGLKVFGPQEVAGTLNATNYRINGNPGIEKKFLNISFEWDFSSTQPIASTRYMINNGNTGDYLSTGDMIYSGIDMSNSNFQYAVIPSSRDANITGSFSPALVNELAISNIVFRNKVKLLSIFGNGRFVAHNGSTSKLGLDLFKTSNTLISSSNLPMGEPTLVSYLSLKGDDYIDYGTAVSNTEIFTINQVLNTVIDANYGLIFSLFNDGSGNGPSSGKVYFDLSVVYNYV